jgi:Spy/CpxP family protein refolding chaperone
MTALILSGCSKDDTGITKDQTTTVDYTQQMAPESSTYSLTQAMSDNGQLMTIAFSGLAFITGDAGSDSFFPPGKVADFFGFQYMRDIDEAGYGHNTQFLTRAANNMLAILTTEQKAKLVALAKEQASVYCKFAYNRFPLMNAFRKNMEGNIPSGSSGLNQVMASKYCANLYKTDADLSYNRALMMGNIVQTLTDNQKTKLATMKFNNFNTWPDVAEDADLKKNLTNSEFVAVMTYASELFSWYKGGVNADIYFCPERHGTYFGGFYLKDYPAMNNPNYFIPLDRTGQGGNNFLNTLTVDQRNLISSIITEQKIYLTEIAQIRSTVSKELRKAMNGLTIDKTMVYQQIERYGELDGLMSALYAIRFAAVYKTLTPDQKTRLYAIRDLTVYPNGAYRFSTSVSMPVLPNTDYLFGIGSLPVDAANYDAPASFCVN